MVEAAPVDKRVQEEAVGKMMEEKPVAPVNKMVQEEPVGQMAEEVPVLNARGGLTIELETGRMPVENASKMMAVALEIVAAFEAY